MKTSFNNQHYFTEKMLSGLLPVLLSMLFMLGCASPAAAVNSNAGVTAKVPSLTIYNASAFFGTRNAAATMAMKQWDAHMSSVYHTTVRVDTDANVFSSQLKNGSAQGLAYLQPEQISDLYHKGEILPLDDYLKNNKNWIALPDYIKNQYTYKGHIWAIPTSCGYQCNVSVINNEWLKKLGLPVPQNLTDLYNLGTAIAAKNPSGDGKKNDYLFGDYLGYSAIETVFNTYGLNFGTLNTPLIGMFTTNTNSIGYDLKSDSVVDGMSTPQAKEALTYLNNMYKNGMIVPGTMIYNPSDVTTENTVLPNSAILTGRLSDLYITLMQMYNENHPTANGNIQAADFNQILPHFTILPPLISGTSQMCMNDSNAYVLLKNTKKPSDTVNLFVDMLFANANSYMDCCLGPGNYVIGGDNTIERTTQTSAMPGLTSLDPTYLADKGYTVTINGVVSADLQYQVNVQKEINAYIAKYTATGQMKFTPVFDTLFNSSTYGSEKSAINKYTIESIYKAILADTSGIDQQLSSYRYDMSENYNLETILKEANTSIGKIAPLQK